MKTVTQKAEKDLVRPGRRVFLANAELVVKFLAFFALLLPLARFLGFTPPAKPKFFEVNKVLKEGGFIIEADFILFDIANEPIAVSRTCTHLGCKLNYHELEGVLICPCHKSQFGKDGKRLAGPARLDLPIFTVEKIGGTDITGYIVAIS
ncbi:MAG: Rieske 2Fe-2S domain-containing protein [Thermodesulfobacteriota bacterium]